VNVPKATPDTQSTIPASECLLVSEDVAAAMCGCSKPTFRSWVAEGLISPVKLPHGMRRRLYRREDLEAFVESLGS
jgi:excisionase family DNA binding protein